MHNFKVLIKLPQIRINKWH